MKGKRGYRRRKEIRKLAKRMKMGKTKSSGKYVRNSSVLFFSVTEFLWVHVMHPDSIQFSQSYFFWACYKHLPMGSVLLCFPGKVQVSLSLALHLVSWMISSPSSVASAILYFLYSVVLGAKDNNTDGAVAGPSHGLDLYRRRWHHGPMLQCRLLISLWSQQKYGP